MRVSERHLSPTFFDRSHVQLGAIAPRIRSSLVNITMIFSMGWPTRLLSLLGHVIGILELRGRVELLSALMSSRARALLPRSLLFATDKDRDVQTNKNR